MPDENYPPERLISDPHGFGELQVVRSKYVPPGTAYLLNPEQILIVHLEPKVRWWKRFWRRVRFWGRS